MTWVGSVCVQQRCYSVQGEDGCAGMGATWIEDEADPRALYGRISTDNGHCIRRFSPDPRRIVCKTYCENFQKPCRLDEYLCKIYTS